MRIVSGRAGGRRIAAPPGRATRPTSDRTREALFSTLTAMRGGLAGARVLDLYAGSGAVGLEALSRGAASALLVESDRAVIRVIRHNVDELGLDGAQIAATTVERFVAEPAAASSYPSPYHIVFLDPPYSQSMDNLAAVVGDLRRNGWLAQGAIVAVERSSRSPDFIWPAGFHPERSRRYGEGSLWYGRAAMETAGSAGGDG
jgi:16S rRNA (guanine966-N2)-methyltransferase